MTTDRATELRLAFDRAFAAAPAPPEPPTIDLLRVRLGGERYALLLSELSALHVDLAITPVPTPRPALLGVATVRGAIVPIYDLRRVIGAAATGAPRWIVLIGGASAGLAFDGFDGHARHPTTELATTPGGGVIRGSIVLADGPCAVVNLDVVATTIRERWSRATAAKEHE